MADPYEKVREALSDIDLDDLQQRLKEIHTRIYEIDRQVNELNKEKQRLHDIERHYKGIHNLAKYAPLPDDTPEESSEKLKDLTIVEACKVVLEDASGPLHLTEIVNRVKKGGYGFRTDNPTASVESTIQRESDLFEKVGPRTYKVKKK